jgi:addiction module HigA family antidote
VVQFGDETKFAPLNYNYAVVRLASEGGNVYSAVEIGRMVWKRGYTTLVTREDYCASACTHASKDVSNLAAGVLASLQNNSGKTVVRIGETINGGFASNGAKARRGTWKSSTTTKDDAMSIRREDLDAGLIDFADVVAGKKLPLIHPGEILRDDFLRPMTISVYALAQAIKVPRSRVNDIVLGRRGITADTAFRLARYFGTSPDFWINLQARYDLEAADRKLRRRIEREVTPRAA